MPLTHAVPNRGLTMAPATLARTMRGVPDTETAAPFTPTQRTPVFRADPRAGAPAGPPATATSVPPVADYDRALLGLLTQPPYADGTTGVQALLNMMGQTCASWERLTPAQKAAAIQAVDLGYAAVLAPGSQLGMSATQFHAADPFAAARRWSASNAPRATWLRYSDAAIARAVAILDAACGLRLTGGAGQAAAPTPSPYLQSASYLNGPTLLAAGVAVFAGYVLGRKP